VPGIATDTRARVLEWFELEPRRRNPYGATVGQQSFAIGRDKVRQRPPLPDMSMEPEPTVHGVNHSLAPRTEFPERWQRVAVATRLVSHRVASGHA